MNRNVMAHTRVGGITVFLGISLISLCFILSLETTGLIFSVYEKVQKLIPLISVTLTGKLSLYSSRWSKKKGCSIIMDKWEIVSFLSSRYNFIKYGVLGFFPHEAFFKQFSSFCPLSLRYGPFPAQQSQSITWEK